MKETSEDSLKKLFFPKFKLLNSGCGLSTGAAYLRVFTVSYNQAQQGLPSGSLLWLL